MHQSKFQRFEKGINNRAGFTLVELLIVIVLVGIIAAITAVNFNSYSQNQALNQAALNIKNDIEKTKFNSVSRTNVSACGNGNSLLSFTFDIINDSPGQYQIIENCNTSSVASPIIYMPSNVIFRNSNKNCKIIFSVNPNNNIYTNLMTLQNAANCKTASCPNPAALVCLQLYYGNASGPSRYVKLDKGGNVWIQ